MAVVACDRDTPTEKSLAPAQQYAAVYYWHEDGGLLPEYRTIDDSDVVQQMWDYLVTGPQARGLVTKVDAGSVLLQQAEPEEGRMLLELNDRFWSAPPRELHDATAQIVNTMGSLEGGDDITLIDDVRPGLIDRPSGQEIAQSLTIEDFPAPLVRISQPVPGAVVGSAAHPNDNLSDSQVEIPIVLTLAHDKPVIVSAEMGGNHASMIVHDGRGRLLLNNPPAGEWTIVIQLDIGVTVEFPVHITDPAS